MQFKINKTSNYTVVNNEYLRNKEMSLKAKGLLTLMLSLPPNWDYSINGLVAICNEGRDAVRETLDELKKFGHLKINKIKDEKGKFTYEYEIFEIPEDIIIEEEIKEEKTKKENKETQKPKNIEISTKNIDEIEKQCEEIWAIYPYKKGKMEALKNIKKLINTYGMEQLKRAIERYKESKEVKNGYIQQGGRFFTTSIIDYLDANYVENVGQAQELSVAELKKKYINWSV